MPGPTQAASDAELLEIEGRVFLEVVRFDRLPNHGRRGVLSIWALEAEFVGELRSWSATAERLAALGVIPGELVPKIRWLETFGTLIANTDMHFGNLSFLTRGATVVDLAPAYDTLPMWYAPQHGHITRRDFQPPLPEATHAALWQEASMAAEEFWSRVAVNSLVSERFREIARSNQVKVQQLAAVIKHLV